MFETEKILENLLGSNDNKKQEICFCDDCFDNTPHWLKGDAEVCMKCGTRRL